MQGSSFQLNLNASTDEQIHGHPVGTCTSAIGVPAVIRRR